MQFSVETTSKLGRKVHVTIPAEDIDQKITAKLQEMQPKVKLSGFRPGKVPMSVVKQRFGDSVREEVVSDLIRSTYVEALEKEKLNPAGMPHIEPESVEPGKPLVYAASFEVFPEIELKLLDGVKLEKPTAKVEDADVEEMLQKLRKQHATWEEVDRASQKGDQLTIDFEGKIKDEVFEGGSAKDFKFELGAGSMLEDFDKAMYDLKAGEKTKFKVKFPKDYHAEAMAGKKADFEVTLHKVHEMKLPELNEEFFTKVGINEGGEDKLRSELRHNMEQQLEQIIQSKFKGLVLDKLLELNPIEVPNALVDEEISRLQQRAKEQFSQYTGTPADKVPDMPRENFESDARKNVALGLLLNEFIKKNELKVDPDKLHDKIKSFAAAYDQPEEVINWYYKNKQQRAHLEAVMLEDVAVDKLQESANIVEKKLSFDELMNPPKAKSKE